MQTLEQLAVKIEAAHNLSTQDLSGWDSRTRPSIEIAKRQATDDLVKLKKEYAAMAKQAAAGIFLTGSEEHQKIFSEIAEDEGDTITVDGLAMYKRIALKVLPTIGGDKQFGVTQSFIFLLEVQDIMRELEFADWNAPVNTKPATVTNEQDMLALASKLIGEIGGARILSAYIEKLAVEEAIKQRYIKSVIPVVITGLNDLEREALSGLFTGNNITVELPEGKQVNKETVIKAFIQLKKKTTKK